MSKFILLIRLVILVLLKSCWGRCHIPKTLKLVNLVFRHGDRTPVRTYPTDPYDENFWPNGLGQLTEEGVKQQYELGQFLRNRYDLFLDRQYKRRQIYVRSTDKDRALLSAQSCLSALYNHSNIGIRGINWQPVPIHTVQIEKDFLLYPHYDCPRYKQLWKKSIEEMDLSQYQSFYEYVAKHAGLKQKEMDIQWLWHIAGTLMVQVSNGLTLPSWVTPDVYDTIIRLKDIEFQMKGHIPEMIRVTGGNLLKKMINDTEALFKAELDEQMKMFMYSAHDTTVSVVLRALKNFNGLMPPYSTCVMLEAHDTGVGEPYIQIHLRNDTSRPPYHLTLQGCTPDCPLSRFKEILLPLLPQDIDTECRLKFSTAAPVIGFTSSVLVMLFLVTFCPCLSCKNWTRYVIKYS
ncbi:testicular acid phosphatase homolog [Tubulanus polymorphus]|uniref:testicular acid phosphatase homolog n=1 Tax=Tubulanus polymorphus TaxID=672921 RepID=UPI003DA5E3EE